MERCDRCGQLPGTVQGVGDQQLGALGNGDLAHTINNLAANTQYDISVRGRDGSDAGDATTIMNVRTLRLAAPGNLAATSSVSTQLVVTWSAVTNAANYQLRYKLNSSSSWGSWGTATSPRTITGLTANTQYNIEVRARDSSNSEGDAAAVTARTLLAPPTNEAASAAVATQLTVTWTAVSGATSYEVQHKLSSAGAWGSSWATATASPYTITGLAANTQYDIRVRAKSSSNTGEAVEVTNIWTPLSPPTGLWHPTDTDDYDPRFGRFGSGWWDEDMITVFWNALTDAASYEMRYRAVKGTQEDTWSAWADADEFDREHGLTLSDLFPAYAGIEYEIELRGVHSSNRKGEATSYTAQTKYNAPTAVSNVRVASNDGELAVAWTPRRHNESWSVRSER